MKAPNGIPRAKDKELTGFSNADSTLVNLRLPLYVKTDGLQLTGQNPASSEAAAKQLLQVLHRIKTALV